MFKALKTRIENMAGTSRIAAVTRLRWAVRSRFTPLLWGFEAEQKLTVKVHLARSCASTPAGNATLHWPSSCRYAADNKGLLHFLETGVLDKRTNVNLNREGPLDSHASSGFFGAAGSVNANC